ncbi:MAG: hypothetical protein NC909_01915 [Candidatus Omnitrophica bacterium]|nr:hypothetical protein [Candidatus Omnitrophota bacterium]
MSLYPHNPSIVLAFLGGLGLSFSGCIYPLIPVFLGFLSGHVQKKKMRGFLLSFVYVSGFAFIYSLMGLIASLSGSVFGIFLSYPITRITAGFIFIIFGLSMLEIFYLPTISLRLNLRSFSRLYLHVFFMGLSSGLIISPCVSPVLGSILLYVAMKKDLFYGWLLLISFAYGLGFILIL